MRCGLVTIIAGVCVLGLLGGCRSSLRTFAENVEHVSTTDDAVLVDVTDVISLDIESFNGDVLVRVDDDLAQASIIMTRVAHHGFSRREEARPALEEIHLSAEIVPGELGQELRVRTSTTNGEPHLLRAHLEMRVPTVEGVHIATHHGRVEVKGVTGEVSINNHRGDVIVASNRPLTEAVSVNVATDGDINYRVRGESSGRFDCETERGNILNKVRYGVWRVQRGTSTNRLVALLNEGGNPVTLRTGTGNINIVVVPNPEEYGMYILD